MKALSALELAELGLKTSINFSKAMTSNQLLYEGVAAVALGIPDGILNHVIDTQLTEEKLASAFDAVMQFFKLYPSWSWVLNSLSQPLGIADFLQARGFALVEEYPAMYFDLMNPLPSDLSTELAIQEAKEDLSDWIQPITKAFGSSDGGKAYREVNFKNAHGIGTQFRHFVGIHDSKMVSAGTLFLSDEAVMIHNVGTDPEFSRRGYATAMMLYMMRLAQSLGFRHCFLEASSKGVALYERIGFKVYDRCRVYELRR